MNADPEVVRFLPGPLSRPESDALMGRIEAHFDASGYGLWAVEEEATGTFAGFVGLLVPRFEAPFMPAVEMGWRLTRSSWGRGYATEGGRRVLAFAFEDVGLDEIVSFTVPANTASRAVMDRLGLTRDESADFDHPRLPVDSPLRRHVLYRLCRHDWRARRGAEADR